MPLLLTLFLTPIIAAGLVFSFVKNKSMAIIFSLIPLGILMYAPLAPVDYPWISTLNIRFHLSVDSLSLIFLYLVNIIIPISIAAQNTPIEQKNVFYGLILVLQGLLIGFFTSQDLVCFTFFFEAMLIPLYFLISSWGKNGHVNAAFKFIIYMAAGSCLLVAALLATYLAANSFDMMQLAKTAEKLPHAALIAAAFLLAFCVKTPLWPFHAWLPDAYTKAPLSATILLSAILSKAGIYGIIRVSMGLFPHLSMQWSPYLITLSIIGVLYGAFAAWGQTDFKRLIAYSSFSHVNFVLVGLFVWNQMAHSGAILQAVNHAITITGLFLVASWLEKRLGTTQFGQVSGLACYMPRLCWITFFFVMSAVALPGLNNFISEVMVLYGVFQVHILLSALLGLTVIFSILYMLRWIHSVYFETPSPYESNWLDIKAKETSLALPLIALIIWLGIYPGPVLNQVELAANTITEKST